MKIVLLLFAIPMFIPGCTTKIQVDSLPNELKAYREVVQTKDIATYSNAAFGLREFMIENDPYYPIYHFTPAESWMNDPNGPIYYKGKYHLFYQFDPQIQGGNGEWKRSRRTWGHAVSNDLVHWKDWPVAVWPDTPFDSAGVYSGNTFVDDNGDLCGLYTGNVDGHRETYGLLIRSNDDGLTFDKKMVMDNSQRPNPDSPVHWDGQVWKHEDIWYQLIGGTTGGENARGAAWLWSSPDLENWTLIKNIAPTLTKSTYWELPYLIKLDNKYVLFVGSGNPYWIGDFDYSTMEFIPDDPKPRFVDLGFYYSFNVNMVDDKGPHNTHRQLMHGWLTSPPTITEEVPWWQSAHAIPRVISIKNNRLWQEPVPEIAVLRRSHWQLSGEGIEEKLKAIEGDALELMVSFSAAATDTIGLRLRVSDDRDDFVRVYYDPGTKTFGVNGPTIIRNMEEINMGRKSGLVSQQINLKDEKDIVMHVFLDRSVLEMYMNGYAITGCFFSCPGARHIEIEGDSRILESLDVWEMTSMWNDQIK